MEAALDFVLAGNVNRPIQIKEEIRGLLRVLRAIDPKVLIEIGTAEGGTLFLFCKVANPRATIISVDLPRGAFGGGYPKWKIPLYQSFVKRPQKLHLLRADSHDPATLDRVKQVLRGKRADFLFIDGDHTYEGVKKDFQLYSPLVKNGGIIAFHDIIPGEGAGGVPIFWAEVKSNYACREITKSWNQGGFGIGVLRKN